MLSGDMGKVEENTRYTAVALIGSQGVIDLLWANIDRWWDARDFFLSYEATLGWIWEKLDASLTEIVFKLGAIHDRAADIWDEVRFFRAEQAQKVISVQIDGREVARALMTYMQDAGVEP
jgi:hypothetical protein